MARRLARWSKGSRGRRLEERLRAGFVKGAEEESQRRLGRALGAEELERISRRFPRTPRAG